LLNTIQSGMERLNRKGFLKRKRKANVIIVANGHRTNPPAENSYDNEHSSNMRVEYRCIEMHRHLWQSFEVMAKHKTQITSRSVRVLVVLLFAAVAAGVPQAEVHAHANARYGHSHDFHDHDAQGANSGVHVAGADDAGQLHFHDTGVQSPTMLDTIDIAPVPCGKAGGDAMPPATRPPDNPITQLYRPPIA
jgi:hypothetical protein